MQKVVPSGSQFSTPAPPDLPAKGRVLLEPAPRRAPERHSGSRGHLRLVNTRQERLDIGGTTTTRRRRVFIELKAVIPWRRCARTGAKVTPRTLRRNRADHFQKSRSLVPQTPKSSTGRPKPVSSPAAGARLPDQPRRTAVLPCSPERRRQVDTSPGERSVEFSVIAPCRQQLNGETSATRSRARRCWPDRATTEDFAPSPAEFISTPALKP